MMKNDETYFLKYVWLFFIIKYKSVNQNFQIISIFYSLDFLVWTPQDF